jgi:amino acid adenylation domain-containing protein
MTIERPLGSGPRPERIPLAFEQRRLWLFDRFRGGRSTEYHMPVAWHIRGALDQSALRQALDGMISRHEVLRTTLVPDGVEARQVIAPESPLAMPVEDLRAWPAAAQHRRVQQVLAEEWQAPFDLTRQQPLRVRLLELATEEFVFVHTGHHIATDRWSQGIFNSELAALYSAARRGSDSPLPPLEVQFADFAVRQRQRMTPQLSGVNLEYWTRQLSGIPDGPIVPTDRRPPRRTAEADVHHQRVGPEIVARLKALGRSRQTTLYMTLLAAFGTVLSRYGGQRDIVIGSPVSTRTSAVSAKLLGFFVNTLPIRMKVLPGDTFGDVLAAVRLTAVEAHRHQFVQLDQVVDAIGRDNSRAAAPLFQVWFALHNEPWQISALDDLRVEQVIPDVRQLRDDLELHVFERAGELSLTWLYSPELFDRARIEQISALYQHFLEEILNDSDRGVASIGLPDKERERLSRWNSTVEELPPTVLPALIEAQVERTPSLHAVVSEDETLTFRELNARANQLAHALIEQGIGPERSVAIAMQRSASCIVALLGVLKTGASFLPIDPDYPDSRLEFMCDDGAVDVVLADPAVAVRLGPRFKAQCLAPETWQSTLRHLPITNPTDTDRVLPLRPEHPVYVLYTSGSTGEPKGAVNTHRALVNRLLWMQHTYHLDQSDRVIQKTPCGFDVSVWEYFWPLIAGATLVVIPAGRHRDPKYLADTIARRAVTTAHFVPSMLRAFLESLDGVGCESLRRIICSGEALTADVADRTHARFPHLDLHNLYGPTEAAIDVTAGLCRRGAPGESPTIGAPIWNTGCHVADQGLSVVPASVPGQLYLTGIGLARGYHRRPALTATRFVADPFGPPGTRMYRTGDIASWRLDGQLEFIGRSDAQLKIRGMRVEPGEVEATLRQHEAVADAAVVPDERDADRLVGFVSLRSSVDRAAATGEQLRGWLASRLPAHLVPATLTVLGQLPLTSSGKLDRRAITVLPEPERPLPTYCHPGEQLLCELFQEVLSVQRVSPDDNFFDLGGHSLSAMRLIARIRARFGIELDVQNILDAATPSALLPLVVVSEVSYRAVAEDSLLNGD